MRKYHALLMFMLCSCFAQGQEETDVPKEAPSEAYRMEIEEFQEEMNAAYADEELSPLKPADRESFQALPFFPINPAYRIVAKFVRTENESPFGMRTTTDRLPVYEKYGEARFTLNGKEFRLSIYQNHKLRETEEYKDYLFLPFTDKTNGKNSYSGGRYIELSIPEGDTIVIDFNKAYNPYCAYNARYSCPIPPSENKMSIKVEAGVMYEK